jgi:hypothetical protein
MAIMERLLARNMYNGGGAAMRIVIDGYRPDADAVICPDFADPGYYSDQDMDVYRCNLSSNEYDVPMLRRYRYNMVTEQCADLAHFASMRNQVVILKHPVKDGQMVVFTQAPLPEEEWREYSRRINRQFLNNFPTLCQWATYSYADPFWHWFCGHFGAPRYRKRRVVLSCSGFFDTQTRGTKLAQSKASAMCNTKLSWLARYDREACGRIDNATLILVCSDFGHNNRAIGLGVQMTGNSGVDLDANLNPMRGVARNGCCGAFNIVTSTTW